jgi:DNA modification methylase
LGCFKKRRDNKYRRLQSGFAAATFPEMTLSNSELSSPKRNSQTVTGKAAWYSYYAGFSTPFVQDVIRKLGLPHEAIVADPWNGAGTTTQVAHELRMSALGADINPAMVMVSKARLLGNMVDPSQTTLCTHILRKASVYRADVLEEEPLALWFAPQSATLLRNIERSIQFYLVGPAYSRLAKLESLSSISSLSAFFYVALFRTVRELLAPFRTTNPTWIKKPKHPSGRLRPSEEILARMFKKHVETMTAAIPNLLDPMAQSEYPEIKIDCADSKSLPWKDGVADAAIASPPYCTRIDYGIATLPELRAMGFSSADVRKLRERMIGTSTIATATPASQREWGDTCNSFLAAVRQHRSHSSASYYIKNHLQYFDGLFRSLKELNRILKPGSRCVLVVQDSYYKEIKNDLPQIVTEMGQAVGWKSVWRDDFPVEHSMARAHAHAETYRTESTATESVLWFVRA